MKKVISLTFVLLFMFSMKPVKVEAKVLPVTDLGAYKATTVSTENYSVYICDGSGHDCPVQGVLIR